MFNKTAYEEYQANEKPKKVIKLSKILKKPGLMPSKTVRNLHTIVKPDKLTLSHSLLGLTDTQLRTPRERTQGFSYEAYQVVKKN